MNNQPKILIVDDEPFNVDYLEQELEDLNYTTVTAVNGQEALEKISSEAPDLVLLDIMMPIMDGFSVLGKVKAAPAIRDIPIIVISANNDLQSTVKGIQLGAEDYLPKPFEPTLLKARIQSSLEKKRLRDMQSLYLKSLEREMNIARDIQKEFLPAQLPEVPGWEIASYFEAAKEVAGDFYDAFTLPDGTLTFLVADVCGKGIGAALFMTLFRSLIHAASISDQFSVGQAQPSLSAAERLQHAVTLTNNYVAET
ncbi:MAG TPA: response regulator, partial [Anaerolineales bacterium]|nr:response regulator [Anaerolineales bacterium]